MSQKTYNLRKKIAKHGDNSIIIIPKMFRNEIRPKTLVDVTITILEEPSEKD